MEEKISIIIPAYNVAECLGRTLESVLAQTYANMEVILVNDGSRDETGAVMDCYAARDSRIHCIHKENGGVTSARLRGVAEATGQWIGFVDGDDYVEPDMFERLLTNALTHQADISHCGYRMVFPSGKVDFYYNTEALACQDRMQGMEELISGRRVEPALVNKLFRRKLFDPLLESGRMPRDIRNTEDLLMNYYLFREADSSVYEDVCPYHYVLRKGSAATAKQNIHKLQDPLKVLQIIYGDAPEELRDTALQRLARQLISGATMASGGQKELIGPFRASCRRELRGLLGEILGSGCEGKVKIMALWAAVWPGSYCLVHTLYAKIRGIDKKYQID